MPSRYYSLSLWEDFGRQEMLCRYQLGQTPGEGNGGQP